ncbi:ATP synthase regulation protein NCA2 [Mucor ambiguus]|uniref:ATP synthase regulation protein NCA2 n=1 Tax=Mucor ambiguus TaxID=91626 RepID=A0A0C9MD69_9FUNG|nr:ATP synthase regulation protein NCA2 [Mucor ambiguus]
MSTFVNEQVKRLNTSLTQSFEKHIASTTRLSSLNEKDKFLLETSQALDLTSSNLPSFKKVQEYLEKYHEFKAAGDVNAESEAADPALEWLFVAKCTIAVYGQVFSKILNLTLPISESIDYWNSIHGSTTNELYYAMQIAPSRIYSLLKNTTKQISNASSAVDQVKSLFTSSDYVLSQLFPIHNSGIHNDKVKAEKQQSLKSFNAFKFFNLSSYHRRPLILEIISSEVLLKRKSLQQFRSEQAASLGVLLLTPPQFNSQDDFASATAKETKSCIEVIKYVMGSAYDNSQQIEKNTHHLQQRLSTMDLRGTSANDATAELYSVAKRWSSTYNSRLQCIQSSYGTPSVITRYWIPALGSYFVGGLALRYGFKRKEDIIHWVEEAGKTAHDFILNWIWEPVVKVYGTIRLKDQRLSLLSKEGLQSDLDSLERMVIGFAKDNLHMSEHQLSQLAINVREGDMSVLLKEYEKEIKNPLRNVITGDLLQTILIQVQKTKVDVDLAMSALDKLLKSNELNFAFLAVAPSMLLTWASVSWFRNTIQGRSQQKMKKTGLPMKETLRRIERQLVVMEPIHQEKGELNEWSSNNQHQTECETQGILLCEVHLLRAYARSLPLQNSTRARFLEDIRDLENPSLTNEQKIQTIARMSRFWKFLS